MGQDAKGVLIADQICAFIAVSEICAVSAVAGLAKMAWLNTWAGLLPNSASYPCVDTVGPVSCWVEQHVNAMNGHTSTSTHTANQTRTLKLLSCDVFVLGAAE